MSSTNHRFNNSVLPFPLVRRSFSEVGSHQAKEGVVNIALVVTVTIILVFTIFTIQAITLLTARITQSNISQKVNFYAAEGLLYDAIVRLNNGESPNKLTGSTSPFKDLNINRQVSFSPATNLYTIDVTATDYMSSRHLNSSFRRITNNVPPIDIAIIVDTSGSMDDEGCNINAIRDRCNPIWSAQAAAQLFVDTLKADPGGANAYAALIKFSNIAQILNPLQSNFNSIKQQLTQLRPAGWTNPHNALQKAQTLNWRSGSHRFIILLTDGLPNRLGSGPTACSPAYPTSINACATDTINLAATMKNPQGTHIIIYTIGLGLDNVHDYIQQPQIQLAHSFLDQVASTPPAQYAKYSPTSQQLQAVYQEILFQILSNPYLRIQECPAGTVCN